MALPNNNPIQYKIWCQRCRRYHNGPSVDPDKIVRDHAKDLAKAIDQEVIERLKRGNA
jgi:hypothetical protein